MPIDPTLWLLQSNDSSYPSGAYAHSFGLEELAETGVVSKPADLERFLERQVLPALLTFDLPFFARAHRAACDQDAASVQNAAVHRDRIGPGEACVAVENIDALRGETMLSVLRHRIGKGSLESDQLSPINS